MSEAQQVRQQRVRGFDRLLVSVSRAEGSVEQLLGRRKVFLALVATATVAVAAIRLMVALSVRTVGGDYGHYLVAMNWYLGVDRTGEGPFDPPFVPFLLILMIPFLGKVVSLQILGPIALASMLPAAVFFLNRFIPRWAAVAAATVFVLWPQFAELIAHGGVTNLFGLAFGLVFYRLFFEVLDHAHAGGRMGKRDVAAGAVLFLVISTHHLTAFFVAATALLWLCFALLVGMRPRPALAWSGLRVFVVAMIPSLIYLPYLITLLVADLEAGLGQPTALPVFSAIVANTWRLDAELWIGFLGLGLLALVRFDKTSTLGPCIVSFFVAPTILVLSVLRSHPVRAMLYLQFPIVVAGMLWTLRQPSTWLPRTIPPKVLGIARLSCLVLVGVSLVILPVSSVTHHQESVAYYHHFQSPQMFEAFDWVQANTSPEASFAVASGLSSGFADRWQGQVTGWWLEGYANRRALYEGHPPLIPSPMKQEDVREANRFFAGETVFEDGILRVADSFPWDDAAGPTVYTGYLGDYHEFVGFSLPRLVDARSGNAYVLIRGAGPNFFRGLEGSRGWVTGNYSGPDFAVARMMTLDSSKATMTLDLIFELGLSAPWTTFEMTLHVPPWTQADLDSFGQGVIDCRVLDSFGYNMEAGRIEFVASGLGSPSQLLQRVTSGEGIVSLRWPLESRNATLRVSVVLAEYPTTGPTPHPLMMRTSQEILEDHAIDYVFITTDSLANIQRFDRQVNRFARVFQNDAVVIFRVIGVLGGVAAR